MITGWFFGLGMQCKGLKICGRTERLARDSQRSTLRLCTRALAGLSLHYSAAVQLKLYKVLSRVFTFPCP